MINQNRLWFLSCLVVLVYFVSLDSAAEEYSFEAKDPYNNNIQVTLTPLGCFKDRIGDRALRNIYYNHRGSIDWDKWSSRSEPNRIILDCAKRAFNRGYTLAFAVQFYGECWSDGDAERRYSMHGASTECTYGVGKANTNFVYGFRVQRVQSSEKSCTANGKNYNIGDQMEIPNDWSSAPFDAMCQKCVCGSDGNPIDCLILHYCDLGLGPLCSRYKNVTGHCCPKCDCYNDGQVQPVGTSWPVNNANDECSMCTCGSNGIATCTEKSKCPVCYGDEEPNPGQCCPKCVAKTTTTQGPQAITPATERPGPVLPPIS